MIQHQRNINMYPGVRAPERIHLSQYDSDFTLVFSLYSSAGSFSVDSGTTVMIRGTKGDGNGYSANASLSGTTVTVQGNNQMTAVAGPNTFELVLTRSGKVLSTANFILDVEPAAMDADTIQSETVLKELQAIIDSASTSTAAATRAEEAATAAEGHAEGTVRFDIAQSKTEAEKAQARQNIGAVELSEIDVESDEIVSPEYLLWGLIYGASPYDIKIYNWCRIAVYKVEPNTKYRFCSLDVRPRFAIGLYNDAPTEGSTPTYYEVHNGEQVDFYFTTENSTNYVGVYYWLITLDATDAFTTLKQIILTKAWKNVEPIQIVNDSVLSGGTPHEYKANAGLCCAIYKVDPDTAYRFVRTIIRSRFYFGFFDNIPEFGDVATYFQKFENQSVNVIFTTSTTTNYIVVYYWNSALDSDITYDDAVKEITLIAQKDKMSVNDGIKNLTEYVNELSVNNKFIKAIGVVEPSYFINGNLHWADPHEIRAGETLKLAVYETSPYLTYKVKVLEMRKILTVGVFKNKPDIGSVPIYYANHHTEHEFEIPGSNLSFYIGIYFYNSDFDDVTYEEAIKTITVIGEKTASVYDTIDYLGDSLDNFVTKKNEDEFVICTWNLGHFAGGKHPSTRINDSDYADKLKEFSTLLQSVNPDIIAVEEYSDIFAILQRENVPTVKALFNNFKTGFIGDQRHYSCTGFYSNLNARNIELKEYECLINETITHSSIIFAQDYYYVQWDMVFNGVDIHCIVTHCAFDTNRPNVLQRAQYQELIDVCADYDKVIIAGDMNSATIDVFKNAGYDVVSNATPPIPFVTGVDNIIVKGLTLIQKSKIETTLSDHNMFIGRIKVQ